MVRTIGCLFLVAVGIITFGGLERGEALFRGAGENSPL